MMMLIPLLFSALGSAKEVDLYVGTYTSPEGSRGIYHARFDPETGAISEPELAAEATNPSFLAIHPNGRTLYSVHETRDGSVSAYAIGADRKLIHLNTQRTDGADPCHLTLDGKGRHLFVASYSTGNLATLPVRADGSLAPWSGLMQNEGSGPNKDRQQGPHMHAVYPTPDDRFVYACDLGTDEILTFRYDAERGTLTPTEPRAGRAPAGGGPRHLALHPNGRFAYANNEMLNSVTVFARHPETGELRELHTIASLPDGEPTAGKSTAEIVLHPSGKWLYVSNRGHDSIAAYTVGEDGTLKLLEIESAGVRGPRSFALDPTGRWLVVAGQHTNDLTALRIDPASGALTPSGRKVSVKAPVCVVFAKP
jgi:6-phosphogluconolactonase